MEFFRNMVMGFMLLSLTTFVNANPIDINTVDARELAHAIIGVGPSKAEAIVNYRIEHGPFKSIDDLIKVKGIGHKIIAENKERLIAE